MEGFRKMIKWHLEKRKISELKNWEKNPRTISEKAFKELEQSVEVLGNFEPLVINIDGTVIAGNQRLRLETKKGNNEVDVYVPERELSEEEIKKIGVISNRHSGEWDMDILANEFEDVIKEMGFDDLLAGFDDKTYSSKLVSPIYEPSEEKPRISELVDTRKTDELLKEIEGANISNEEREFLRLSAQRHLVFNYEKIADHYAHSDNKVKELMESSALVIIDFKKAIEGGFVVLSNYISELFKRDYD